jgi:hypothetical protein
VTNGSSLKQSVLSSPAGEVADPLEVLQAVLGNPEGFNALSFRVRDGGNHDFEDDEDFDKLAETASSVGFGKLSLQEYVDQAAKTVPAARTIRPEPTTLPDYDKENSSFEGLYNSIAACDDVLKSVETYLTSFQADLGAVSTELETLQSRSTTLNTKLENRRTVEKSLGPAIESISISPTIIKTISEAPVDEKWARVLSLLSLHLKTVSANAASSGPLKAAEDVKPLLENLKNKAIERIRDYLVGQIKALRAANVNAQAIQQNQLLPCAEIFIFLHKENKQLAEEIAQAYVNTMRWYYLTFFTRYQKALQKIKIHTMDKTDLLGQEETAKKATVGSGKGGSGIPYDAFNLGRRIEILRSPNNAALPASIAEEEKGTHFLEVPFRNFNLALIDNASSEYVFLSKFLSPMGHHKISRSCVEIFSSTFQLGQAFTKSLIDPSTDCLGVLMAVRLNQRFAFQLQRRKVPTADSYVNATNLELWPRFQKIMDLHNDSLRKTAAAFRSATTDVAKQSAAPHMLTQRFAQFLQGVLLLSSEGGEDEPVAPSLGRLRGEFEALLTKLAAVNSDKRKRERFLFNNISLIRTIIEVRNRSDFEEKGRRGRRKKKENAWLMNLNFRIPKASLRRIKRRTMITSRRRISRRNNDTEKKGSFLLVLHGDI